MRILRHLLAGYFFILSILTVGFGFAIGKNVSKGHDLFHLAILVSEEVAIVVAAFVFCKVWWVLWHEELRATLWCIAASIVSLIAPGIILTVLVLDGRIAELWLPIGLLTLPLAIGIGGSLFGLTAAANSQRTSSHPDLLRVVVNSIFLPYIAFGFIFTGARCVLALLKHRHIPVTSYFAFVFLGFVVRYLFRLLQEELRNDPVETTSFTAI